MDGEYKEHKFSLNIVKKISWFIEKYLDLGFKHPKLLTLQKERWLDLKCLMIEHTAIK